MLRRVGLILAVAAALVLAPGCASMSYGVMAPDGSSVPVEDPQPGEGGAHTNTALIVVGAALVVGSLVYLGMQISKNDNERRVVVVR